MVIARGTFYASSTYKKDPRISHCLNNKTLKKSWIMNKNLVCIRRKKKSQVEKGKFTAVWCVKTNLHILEREFCCYFYCLSGNRENK